MMDKQGVVSPTRAFSIKLTTPDEEPNILTINPSYSYGHADSISSLSSSGAGYSSSTGIDVDLGGFIKISDDDPQHRKDVLSIFLKPSCVDRIAGIRRVIERTINDGVYRRDVASDKSLLSDLTHIIQEYWKHLEPLYSDITCGAESRMDTGWQDSTTAQRMYLIRWAVVFRILNFFKNLLSEKSTPVQEHLYQCRVLFQLLKLLPRALLSKHIASTTGTSLFAGLSTDDSNLSVVVPICIRADATITSFILNSMSGNVKMQELHRPQLWPGAYVILSLWGQKNAVLNIRRYTRDITHIVYLFYTLFVNCDDAEISSYLDLEASTIVSDPTANESSNTHVKLPSARTSAFSRTMTNLTCDTLCVQSAETSNKSIRDGMVFGALMEPQVSSVAGRGVALARQQTFAALNKHTGSFGLSGRDGFFIFLMTLIRAHKEVSKAAAMDPLNGSAALDELRSCYKMVIGSLLTRSRCCMFYRIVESFTDIKAVQRTLRACQHTTANKDNPMSLFTVKENDVHSQMSEFCLETMNQLLGDCGVNDFKLDLETFSENMMDSVMATSQALRTVLRDVMVEHFILETLVCDEKSPCYENKENMMVALLQTAHIPNQDTPTTGFASLIMRCLMYELEAIQHHDVFDYLYEDSMINTIITFDPNANSPLYVRRMHQLRSSSLMDIAVALWNVRSDKWMDIPIDSMCHLVALVCFVAIVYIDCYTRLGEEKDGPAYLLDLTGMTLKDCFSVLLATLSFIKLNRAGRSSSECSMIIDRLKQVMDMRNFEAILDSLMSVIESGGEGEQVMVDQEKCRDLCKLLMLFAPGSI